ncbi:MAG: CTP synthase [Candidatus Andersenbacteria bacterium RIFCSPHIGHO2_02_FULL_45_11]|uniref:CTP synthase n=1 Tax=Candidatus Andersenbacteria bacterium RIFCSPHIGHO2_12_FULL_45_11 TaxID=1797281 RepID=A0A1G1X1Z8_9BACT|nr:MAG: CTP synthase [Candidatus Andersenbacteria bacterium RIFCSPHIGHO2_01_FULL_46_36]OGY31895.1 MAG: CTP synthase [Candidatus Andersenbacteria bacterium RIFCSPHIGHO2_02_FULL_45_11]OGY34036.1 MAG: CTP synthase [Candidatus Andersenbacteria bacterium RIFCSPHIGHO2_12_FULL_45_11]
MKKRKAPKYIFVTGGVLSGLGKGITAASIGNILKDRGLKVNMQKFDQYINVDSGTLNPAEHGEVFVTDDGGETDLDLGHYERFLTQNLTGDSSVMTGEIYLDVINRERRGEYLGKTVQVIPHVTEEVKYRARKAATSGDFDVHIVEIGGTVGDNEGFHFLEAARQMALDEGRENVLYVHVVFLPYLKASDEVKTKPAQNSVRELRSIGIQPDILIARTDHAIDADAVRKMSLYTNVEEKAILPLVTVKSVYEVPLIMEEKKLDDVIMGKLKMKNGSRKDASWQKLIQNIHREKPKMPIAMVGKYTTMLDTYASLVEALKAACWQNGYDLELHWIDAEKIEKKDKEAWDALKNAKGVVVPGGFGVRGTEGKIDAIEFARKNNIPYLGLCLGMQLAAIEFARNVAGVNQATSEEFDEDSKACVIHIMDDQKTITEKGGTMRLGGWDCVLDPKSRIAKAYGTKKIRERHRHRYEFNNDFREKLESKGMMIAGTTPDGRLVEVVEIPSHKWFVAVQFHPEFTSRPLTGHPLFNAFIKAAGE